MSNLEFTAKYWSQISVIIFAIGYIIKIILEYRLKKKEIKFNFIHSRRAVVIEKLYLNFSKLSREVELLALGHNLSKINHGPTRGENKDVIWKIIELNKVIKSLIEENKIYLDENFIFKIESLCENINNNIIVPSTNMSNDINENSSTVYYNTEQFLRFYNKNFPALKKEMINKFRNYL